MFLQKKIQQGWAIIGLASSTGLASFTILPRFPRRTIMARTLLRRIARSLVSWPSLHEGRNLRRKPRPQSSLHLEPLEERALLSGTPQMLADIGSGASMFTASGGLTFFLANDGSLGSALWKTDGTAAGTTLVINPDPGEGSSIQDLTNVNGTLYFEAYDSTGTPGLWKSDGTAAGTQLITYVGSSGAPSV